MTAQTPGSDEGPAAGADPTAAMPAQDASASAPAADATAAMPAQPPGADGAPSSSDDTRKKWLLWGGIGFVAAVLIGIGLFFLLKPDAPAPVVQQSEVPPPPDPTGVEVILAGLTVESTDNAALTASEPAELDQGGIEAAVESARARLEAYFNAMFADETTRFTQEPLDDLLTNAAKDVLTEEDIAALGVMTEGADDIEKMAAAQVDTTATAIADSEQVDMITLTYDAVFSGTATSGPVQMTQSAQLVFVPDGSDWRVQAIDASLDVPDLSSSIDVTTEATDAETDQ